MKPKTIKAILTKKHNDFIKSIDNENVRNVINNNSIITGGAIASMLLNEKVNDYDYYFTNKESAKVVADYFVAKFKELNPTNSISEHLLVESYTDFRNEERLRILVKSDGFVTEGETNPDFVDIDADEISSNALDLGDFKIETEEDPKSSLPKYRPVCLSSNAISLANGVQLIIRFYGNPEEIHSNYDFEHCKCYWVAKTNHLELPQRALLCLLNRELLYTGSKYPLCSIIRTRKFIRRGWQINAGQYVKMAMQLNELDLAKVDVLEDQLTGVDVSYFFQVIHQIKERMAENPDFNLTPAYLIEVVDRLF